MVKICTPAAASSLPVEGFHAITDLNSAGEAMIPSSSNDISSSADSLQTRIEQMRSRLRVLQKSPEGVMCRGELDTAWKDWRGYTTTGTQAVDAEGRPVVGKVVIHVNGEDVVVPGKTGSDELGRAIRNTQVYVFGKEQLAMSKLNAAFIAVTRSPLSAGSYIENPANFGQIAKMLFSRDPPVMTSQQLHDIAQLRTAMEARDAAKAFFMALDAEQHQLLKDLSALRSELANLQ